MSRGIILLAGEGDSTRIVYHALAQRYSVQCVILEEPVQRGEFLKKRLKRLGWKTVVGQILFRGAVVPWLRWTSAQRIATVLRENGLDRGPIEEAVLRRVPSVNHESAISHLRDCNPAVVVVNGTRILTEAVLAAVPAPFLNMHAGITPLYRGVHGAYWALAQRDREHCGVTVHLVDKGIDTGGIVAQARIETDPDDNFVTYAYLQVAAGVQLLLRAVEQALSGSLATCPPPAGPSRLWTHPTLSQYLSQRRKAGVK